jgi:hypothetical protein
LPAELWRQQAAPPDEVALHEAAAQKEPDAVAPQPEPDAPRPLDAAVLHATARPSGPHAGPAPEQDEARRAAAQHDVPLLAHDARVPAHGVQPAVRHGARALARQARAFAAPGAVTESRELAA